MKTRNLLISLGLGLALAVVLLGVLGGKSTPVTAAPAAVWKVCATGSPTCTHTTVQAAVDAASDGDVIKVATGVYTGVLAQGHSVQMVYVSKTVVIRGGYTTTDWETSEPDTNPTTLDAQGQGRVFYITGDPSAGAAKAVSPTIEGLRITGGDATGLYGGSWGWDAGGGLYIVNAEAVISHNQVFSNIAHGGGGLYLSGSTATLNGNVIYTNAANNEGGGIHLFDSAATLDGNIIESNTASDGGGLYLNLSDASLSANTIVFNVSREGGGLYLRESDAVLSGNTIGSNVASDDGGGLFLDLGSTTLDKNRIISNTAYSGGGLFLWGSSPTLHGNVVVANSAQLGGGLFVRESNSRLDNNVVARNQAANQGSGLYVVGSSLWLRHATIAQNNDGDGMGIYITDYGPYYSTVAMTNTILVSHTVGIFVAAGNTASLKNTLWGDGAWANTDDWSGAGTILSTTNVYGNPAFAGADDYHITAESAAKDAGVDAGLNPDIDWDLRPIGAGFDIGADEFPVVVTVSPGISATLVYVDPRNNSTRLTIPGGAVTGTGAITIVYTPKDPQSALPAPEGKALDPHVFDLDVYQNGVHVPHFVFAKAVTLTSEYSNADMFGMKEDSLALYRETAGEWKIIGTRPGETQTLDTGNNLLTAYLWGTSQFGEYGDALPLRFVWLPLVIRNGSSGTAGLPSVQTP